MRCFFMTKYSAKFKSQIIHEYFSEGQSSRKLGKKYQIDSNQIRKWAQQYRLKGIDSLIPRKGKRSFSAEFKLNVIDYYQTHEESLNQVAAKYDLLPSQISYWRRIFNQGGLPALKPHRKGRPPKMTHKRTKKRLKHLANQSEIDRLKAELAEKNKELYDTKLERDILKKSLTLFGPSKHDTKHE